MFWKWKRSSFNLSWISTDEDLTAFATGSCTVVDVLAGGEVVETFNDSLLQLMKFLKLHQVDVVDIHKVLQITAVDKREENSDGFDRGVDHHRQGTVQDVKHAALNCQSVGLVELDDVPLWLVARSQRHDDLIVV
ncbi:hypothetical protein WICPIJ_002551 [Wickerhamomyces pijperi]|uniref:Uncharacterized protein n=1 Tax=Wickerhamomyces pijperi TaxID=599730 RepID=A0A9P8TPQ8_WICPI|nr:hypothetical protein WICPIJ_002551 [Wickerhamomyces pijperi]